MHLENEPVAPVGPAEVRDALLALSLVSATALIHFSTAIVSRSATLAAEMIDASPFRLRVLRLRDDWKDRLAEAEDAAESTLDRMVGWFVRRLDIDAIIAEQVDVEAVVRQVDVVALARTVIYELDLPEIVRNSSQTMAGETVDELRKHGMNADRSVAEFIDRLVGRKARRAPPPGPTIGLGQPT